MDLYFLEAKMPLVKTLEKEGKKYQETPYPLARNFASHREEVRGLDDFRRALIVHSEQGHSLIKGELNRDLQIESRAGSTDPFTRTRWMCLDLDYVEDESKEQILLNQLGLTGVSYIKQYSSGHKLTKPFSAHLFFLLKDPVLPEQLKLWFMERNLNIPMLADKISLTRTAAALRWPLDISVAQNDKIIYIAPPNCIGFEDPIQDRVKLVVQRENVVDLVATLNTLDAAEIHEKKQAKLNELRKAKGMKKRTFKTKEVAGVEVLQNPGETIITGKKAERGFMYFNLNGGDSWGYYHPIDNPEIIYNFKGEPNYLTKELIPSYYRAYKKESLKEQQGDEEETHFAFLDRRSDRYYRGTYIAKQDALELYPTDSVRKVEDFLKQKGQFIGDYIEEWDYLFRFDDDRIFVPEERFVNQYQRTAITRKAEKRKPTSFPPTIKRVLESVSGNDEEVLRHLLNWMGTIVQKRQRTQTMWVMHGCPGTGKGVLVHEILGPILGPEFVQVKALSSFEEEFNAYMERCVILMIDESKRTQIQNQERVMSKLKQACTDPVIPIRKMRSDPYMAKNYMNIIVASNYPDPITVEAGDRRINVANYQKKQLKLDSDDIKQIRKEVVDFAAILRTMKISTEKAKTPLQNDARRKLMYLTQTSLDTVFTAVREGDLQFFIDDLPTDPDMKTEPMGMIDQDKYTQILKEAEYHAHNGTTHKLTRDQTWMLAQFTLSDMPKTANKFSSLAKHYGVTFARLSKAGKKVQGMEVQWKKPEIGVDDVLETQRLRSVK